MSIFEHLARDAVLARSGDTEATLRLARRGLPWIAKSVMPGAAPLIDAAAGIYDAIARPEVKPEEERTSFDARGAGRFKGWLRKLDHGLIVVVGATGSGKTTLLCKLADLWRGKSHRYIIGVDAAALQNTPLEARTWEQLIAYLNAGKLREAAEKALRVAEIKGGAKEIAAADQALEQAKRMATMAQRLLPKNSVVLIPDAGLYLDSHARGNSAEDVIRELAQIARHLSIVIVLDVQFTRLLANSAFLTRCLFYKPLGVTWRVTERDGLIGLARTSQEAFNTEIPPDERIRYSYVFCDEVDFQGFVSIDPPDWYHDGISKAHGNVIDAEFREIDPEEEE